MNPYPLIALLLAAGPAEVQISLSESTLWVGEAVRLNVRWIALTKGAVSVETDDLCFGSLRLLVRGPGGERAYREPPREMCEGLRAPRRMEAGEQLETRLVFFGIGGWLSEGLRSTAFEPGPIFSQPGEYHLRLAYIGGKTEAFSNGVRVNVEMPAVEEEPLLQLIRENPRVTYGVPGWPQLLQRYPAARYLAWTRLAAFGHRLHSGGLADGPAETRRRLGIVTDILAEEWGQFEQDALALAYEGAAPAGKGGPAAEIAARLSAKYAGSKTVRDLGLDKGGTDATP